jgi:hypothetical protein
LVETLDLKRGHGDRNTLVQATYSGNVAFWLQVKEALGYGNKPVAKFEEGLLILLLRTAFDLITPLVDLTLNTPEYWENMFTYMVIDTNGNVDYSKIFHFFFPSSTVIDRERMLTKMIRENVKIPETGGWLRECGLITPEIDAKTMDLKKQHDLTRRPRWYLPPLRVNPNPLAQVLNIDQ